MVTKILAYPHLFPVFLQCVYVCAMVRYAFEKDWTRVVYWGGALIINGSITFGSMK